MVKAIYHESLMPWRGREIMLSREVWGWRILALLFVALLATTAPQFESLKSEWDASIDGTNSQEESESSDLIFENQSTMLSPKLIHLNVIRLITTNIYYRRTQIQSASCLRTIKINKLKLHRNPSIL